QNTLKVERFEVERFNVERFKVECFKVERFNVECFKVERFNVECLNVERFKVEVPKSRRLQIGRAAPPATCDIPERSDEAKSRKGKRSRFKSREGNGQGYLQLGEETTRAKAARTSKKKKAAKRKLKAVKKEMKAPDTDDDGAEKEMKPLDPRSLSEEMSYIFARQELARMLERDPVLVAIRAYRGGDLQGPISEPHLDEALTTLDVLKKLFTLLGEAGIDAGDYDLEELSAFDVDVVMHTACKFVKVAKDLVGLAPDVSTLSPTPHRPQAAHSTGTGSSRYLSPSAEVDSDSSDEGKTHRMPLSATAPTFKTEAVSIKVEPTAEVPSAHAIPATPAIPAAPSVPLELFQRALEAFARASANATPSANVGPPAPHADVAPVTAVGPLV
ncbi:hypothetical protein BBJ28_00025934, partial [Nothophytophthora sp. Chile5]